jgi:NitT/TauT family transport system substrate-binding protein
MSETLVWGVPSFWIERFPLYYGKRLGLFAARGIDLRIRYCWGGPELAGAMAAGEILIGEMGMPPFLRALSDGLKAKVVGSSVIQQLDHYLVGRPEIAGLEGLRGRRLGILSHGSCDDYFVRFMLRSVGVDPAHEVELVPLGRAYGDLRCFGPETYAGRPAVDAGFLVEPFVAAAESRGLVRILAAVRDFYPRYQWGIIVASERALAERRELLEEALAAFRESVLAVTRQPEAAAAYGAQVFRLPKAVFRRALERDLGHWQLDARLDRRGLENCLRVQTEMGCAAPGLSVAQFCRQL